MIRRILLACLSAACLAVFTGIASAADQAAEKKASQHLGVAGGRGVETLASSPDVTGASEHERQQKRKARFREEYGKAANKLEYALANADSPHKEVLVEVVGKLGQFDDPRSIAALKKLEKIDLQFDGDIDVRGVAQSALNRIAAMPDLKKLKTGMSVTELESVTKKYVQGNDTARGAIHSFMRSEAEKDAEAYVPLLVEYYAENAPIRELVKKYPALGDKGLERCLRNREVSVVSNCVSLIAGLKKEQYLDNIQAIAFEKKGNFEYTDQNWSRIKGVTLNAYWHMRELALKQLEQVLYTGTFSDRRDAINYLGSMKTTASVQILKKYQTIYASDKDADSCLLKELDAVILYTEKVIR